MQIKANLASFNAVWAVVADRVRGGFDRDAFTGINLGKNSRAIEAGSVIVTGTPERGGAHPLALHIAAASPETEAVPVRLPPLAAQTPVDFLERVDRYVQAEPALRLRMAIGETPPAHPERLADIEGELKLIDEHRRERRAGPPPDCTVAPTWTAPGGAGRADAPPRRARRARVHAGDGAARDRHKHALRAGHTVGARRGGERGRRAVDGDPQGPAGRADPGRAGRARGRTPPAACTRRR